jgi:hypothetical protein
VGVASVVAMEVPFLHMSRMRGFDRSRFSLCWRL